MRFLLVLSLMLVVDFVIAQPECTWHYGDQGPPGWPNTECAGSKNTPINIDTHDTVHVDEWDPLRFILWNEYPKYMYIKNTGHSAKVTLQPDDCKPMPSVVEGNLQDVFEFAQFHFHWGSPENIWGGSEHTVDHRNFSAEVHFVTYNKKYGNDFNEALTNGDGAPDTLAVFGAFFKVGKYNEWYENILDAFRFITQRGSTTWVKRTPLRKLLPNNLDDFWRYYGGLTTPDCLEVVIWTLFKEPIEVSHKQLEKMYQLLGCTGGNVDGPLVDTFRYTQPLNGRKVYSADLNYKLGRDCKGWAPKYDFYWRETRKEWDFEMAAEVCTKYKGTPFAGLIPVGKLRHFKNYYNYNISSSHEHDEETEFCEGRYFRVNGIKDEFGVWRDFSSGYPVIFTHFPEFQQDHGDDGDTLIWDAHLNRLYTDNRHKHYHALCYREYQRECQTCPGFNFGRECCDAGDCKKCAINECLCDQGFTGRQCEIPPIPDKDIILVGGEAANTDKVNTISKGSCTIANYCDGLVCGWIISTFIFDPHRLLACGGSTDGEGTIGQECKFLDCESRPNQWINFDQYPVRVRSSGETVIKKKGKDIYWWVSGGLDGNLVATRKTYLLDETLNWSQGPTLPLERWEHCAVQIDDCKVAVIGGFIGVGEEGSVQVPPDQFIHILDTEDYNWEVGPALTGDYAAFEWKYTACSKVIDAKSQETIVVIGCFIDGEGSAGLLLWNTASNKLTVSSDYRDFYTCPGEDPASYNTGQMEQINDQWLTFSAALGAGTEVWTFNLWDGFDGPKRSTALPHGVGAVAVTTRGYAFGESCPTIGP